MANTIDASASYTIPTTSYETALCVLPSAEQCEHIDSLRELYDKSYGRWPAHVNIIYPFVAPEHLSKAQHQIQAQFQRNRDSTSSRHVALGSAGLFRQRHNSTAILQESRESSGGALEEVRSLALTALGHMPKPHNFHMTVGQTENNSMASLEFLISKARLLPTLEFEIGSLAILIRERTPGQRSVNRMRLWGTVNVLPAANTSSDLEYEYWLKDISASDGENVQEEDEIIDSPIIVDHIVQPGKTFSFDSNSGNWVNKIGVLSYHEKPTSFAVSSYNVLVDSEFPPARDRDSHLISTLLSDSATADVVVLQEVSDEFLSVLLGNSGIQVRYPFTSHGPSTQPDIGPLPSLRNVVVISKWPFRWNLVPFRRRHKGAVVAVFDTILSPHSFVVAGIHLTCGLTDGSVAAKKVQVHNLLNYLNHQHSKDSWIITGDFNLATSTHTIDSSLKSKSITVQTRNTLASIESLLSEDGIEDAWSATRTGHYQGSDDDDDLFEGEEGATFDPRNNFLAAATSGNSQNRPQRYDRVLVRSLDMMQITGFNMFGLPIGVGLKSAVASDHYGIRATLQLAKPSEQLSPAHREMLEAINIELQQHSHLGTLELETALHKHGMFLTLEQKTERRAALHLLEEVVTGNSNASSLTTVDIPLVMVTVGSFALNVDTSNSDIDCLCIGSISSKTFFKLVRQRLQKAEGQGVRILRKVEAGTGTMLELSVNGVAMDLQYCPAARILERWSEFESLPPSDPIFNLSILSLRKLKPYRDLLYISRTIPDHKTFGIAYRAIKLWATQRGIYSSKFGYLGGVHITLMLSWVYKRVAHETASDTSRSIQASDLVATFLHYYATFNWTDDMVYDAFFHKQKPRYHRTAREPMVVLGFHSPNSNVAHTSTSPGLAILRNEFEAASSRLLDPSMSWTDFFDASTNMHGMAGVGGGAVEFLRTYKTYVSIDIQFWGRMLAKGKSLVGWVESRCLSLVVDIHKTISNFEVRLWPARFTDNTSEQTVDSKDYQGCYLIGLQRNQNVDSTPDNKEERQNAKHSLEKIIDRFISQLRLDEKHYDRSTSWVSASLITQHDVRTQALQLDTRDWGNYAIELDPDSDEEEEEPDDVDIEGADLPKRPVRSKPVSTSSPVCRTKLRPASDILNRLRWDPNLDPTDYIIGYEDRFLGAKEASLENWKTEQTDEEFIPQHRILYFRRKLNDEGDGKGELVWERAMRLDKIFGSGAGAGN